MEYVIRRGERSDLPAIDALYAEIIVEQVVWGMARPSATAEHWPDGILLVAAHQGGLVGFAFGFRSEDSLAVFEGQRTHFEIADLYVRASYRGLGVGSSLLAKLMDAARAQGEGHFTVFSAAKDQHSIQRLYEKHGLKPWGTQFYT